MKSVKWMARNHVAANLLMLVFLVGGVIAALSVKVEVFPEVELDRVTVSVIYPGAGPEEVEDGVVRPIEEAVNGVDGVKRVIANAAEGGASVVVELIEGTNADVALADVKAAVAAPWCTCRCRNDPPGASCSATSVGCVGAASVRCSRLLATAAFSARRS